MKEYTYKIQEKELTQGELTIGQDIELFKLFQELMGDGDEAVPTDMVNTLIETGKLEDMLQIILKGDVSAIEVNDITNSQLEAVVTDFLLLNGSLIAKLSTWLGSITRSVEKVEAETK